jgi:hypothetical protein
MPLCRVLAYPLVCNLNVYCRMGPLAHYYSSLKSIFAECCRKMAVSVITAHAGPKGILSCFDSRVSDEFVELYIFLYSTIY